MVDYSKIIDAATWAFIAKTDALYAPGTAAKTADEQRLAYNTMCAAFDVPHPEGVTTTDTSIADVPVRWYRMEGGQGGPTVLYMHGGGFVVGGLHSHDGVCAEICAATGLSVVAVDYRLSPEHLHPAAFEDCQAVFDQVASDGVVLCGDSAGGKLAATLAHANRRADICGQVLIYPGLGGDMNAGSYIRHAEAPMLTRDDALALKDIRGPIASDDVSAIPLADTDFSGLPPTFIVAAECDPLADDGWHYRNRIQEAGGDAIFVEEAGLVHGYLRARHSVPRATASFARIIAAINTLASGTALAESGL